MNIFPETPSRVSKIEYSDILSKRSEALNLGQYIKSITSSTENILNEIDTSSTYAQSANQEKSLEKSKKILTNEIISIKLSMAQLINEVTKKNKEKNKKQEKLNELEINLLKNKKKIKKMNIEAKSQSKILENLERKLIPSNKKYSVLYSGSLNNRFFSIDNSLSSISQRELKNQKLLISKSSLACALKIPSKITRFNK